MMKPDRPNKRARTGGVVGKSSKGIDSEVESVASQPSHDNEEEGQGWAVASNDKILTGSSSLSLRGVVDLEQPSPIQKEANEILRGLCDRASNEEVDVVGEGSKRKGKRKVGEVKQEGNSLTETEALERLSYQGVLLLSMLKPALQNALDSLGLDTSGLKSVLRVRLAREICNLLILGEAVEGGIVGMQPPGSNNTTNDQVDDTQWFPAKTRTGGLSTFVIPRPSKEPESTTSAKSALKYGGSIMEGGDTVSYSGDQVADCDTFKGVPISSMTVVVLTKHLKALGIRTTGKRKADLVRCLQEVINGDEAAKKNNGDSEATDTTGGVGMEGGVGDGSNTKTNDGDTEGIKEIVDAGDGVDEGESTGEGSILNQSTIHKVVYSGTAVSSMTTKQVQDLLHDLDLPYLHASPAELATRLTTGLIQRRDEALATGFDKAWCGRRLNGMRKAEMEHTLSTLGFNITGNVNTLRSKVRKAVIAWADQVVVDSACDGKGGEASKTEGIGNVAGSGIGAREDRMEMSNSDNSLPRQTSSPEERVRVTRSVQAQAEGQDTISRGRVRGRIRGRGGDDEPIPVAAGPASPTQSTQAEVPVVPQQRRGRSRRQVHARLSEDDHSPSKNIGGKVALEPVGPTSGHTGSPERIPVVRRSVTSHYTSQSTCGHAALAPANPSIGEIQREGSADRGEDKMDSEEAPNEVESRDKDSSCIEHVENGGGSGRDPGIYESDEDRGDGIGGDVKDTDQEVEEGEGEVVADGAEIENEVVSEEVEGFTEQAVMEDEAAGVLEEGLKNDSGEVGSGSFENNNDEDVKITIEVKEQKEELHDNREVTDDGDMDMDVSVEEGGVNDGKILSQQEALNLDSGVALGALDGDKAVVIKEDKVGSPTQEREDEILTVCEDEEGEGECQPHAKEEDGGGGLKQEVCEEKEEDDTEVIGGGNVSQCMQETEGVEGKDQTPALEKDGKDEAIQEREEHLAGAREVDNAHSKVNGEEDNEGITQSDSGPTVMEGLEETEYAQLDNSDTPAEAPFSTDVEEESDLGTAILAEKEETEIESTESSCRQAEAIFVPGAEDDPELSTSSLRSEGASQEFFQNDTSVGDKGGNDGVKEVNVFQTEVRKEGGVGEEGEEGEEGADSDSNRCESDEGDGEECMEVEDSFHSAVEDMDVADKVASSTDEEVELIEGVVEKSSDVDGVYGGIEKDELGAEDGMYSAEGDEEDGYEEEGVTEEEGEEGNLEGEGGLCPQDDRSDHAFEEKGRGDNGLRREYNQEESGSENNPKDEQGPEVDDSNDLHEGEEGEEGEGMSYKQEPPSRCEEEEEDSESRMEAVPGRTKFNSQSREEEEEDSDLDEAGGCTDEGHWEEGEEGEEVVEHEEELYSGNSDSEESLEATSSSDEGETNAVAGATQGERGMEGSAPGDAIDLVDSDDEDQEETKQQNAQGDSEEEEEEEELGVESGIDYATDLSGSDLNEEQVLPMPSGYQAPEEVRTAALATSAAPSPSPCDAIESSYSQSALTSEVSCEVSPGEPGQLIESPRTMSSGAAGTMAEDRDAPDDVDMDGKVEETTTESICSGASLEVGPPAPAPAPAPAVSVLPPLSAVPVLSSPPPLTFKDKARSLTYVCDPPPPNLDLPVLSSEAKARLLASVARGDPLDIKDEEELRQVMQLILWQPGRNPVPAQTVALGSTTGPQDDQFLVEPSPRYLGNGLGYGRGLYQQGEGCLRREEGGGEETPSHQPCQYDNDSSPELSKTEGKGSAKSVLLPNVRTWSETRNSHQTSPLATNAPGPQLFGGGNGGTPWNGRPITPAANAAGTQPLGGGNSSRPPRQGKRSAANPLRYRTRDLTPMRKRDSTGGSVDPVQAVVKGKGRGAPAGVVRSPAGALNGDMSLGGDGNVDGNSQSGDGGGGGGTVLGKNAGRPEGHMAHHAEDYQRVRASVAAVIADEVRRSSVGGTGMPTPKPAPRSTPTPTTTSEGLSQEAFITKYQYPRCGCPKPSKAVDFAWTPPTSAALTSAPQLQTSLSSLSDTPPPLPNPNRNPLGFSYEQEHSRGNSSPSAFYFGDPKALTSVLSPGRALTDDSSMDVDEEPEFAFSPLKAVARAPVTTAATSQLGFVTVEGSSTQMPSMTTWTARASRGDGEDGRITGQVGGRSGGEEVIVFAPPLVLLKPGMEIEEEHSGPDEMFPFEPTDKRVKVTVITSSSHMAGRDVGKATAEGRAAAKPPGPGRNPSTAGVEGGMGFDMSKFRKPGEWKCDACWVKNGIENTKCLSCEAPKPDVTAAPSTSEAVLSGGFPSGAQSSLSSQGRVAAFNAAPPSSHPFPSSGGSISSGGFSFDTPISGGGGKGIGFGVQPCSGSVTVPAPASAVGTAAPVGFDMSKFRKPGEWKCEACYVKNGPEDVKCLSCGTPRPGATAGASVGSGSPLSSMPGSISSGGFSFGSSIPISGGGGGGFKFNTQPSGGFQFTGPIATQNAFRGIAHSGSSSNSLSSSTALNNSGVTTEPAPAAASPGGFFFGENPPRQ